MNRLRRLVTAISRAGSIHVHQWPATSRHLVHYKVPEMSYYYSCGQGGCWYVRMDGNAYCSRVYADRLVSDIGECNEERNPRQLYMLQILDLGVARKCESSNGDKASMTSLILIHLIYFRCLMRQTYYFVHVLRNMSFVASICCDLMKSYCLGQKILERKYHLFLMTNITRILTLRLELVVLMMKMKTLKFVMDLTRWRMAMLDLLGTGGGLETFIAAASSMSLLLLPFLKVERRLLDFCDEAFYIWIVCFTSLEGLGTALLCHCAVSALITSIPTPPIQSR